MQATVVQAVELGLAIGAHPGYEDRTRFGRAIVPMPPEAIRSLVLYQVGALAALASAAGGRVQHVKPHGALYNLASRDAAVAGAIAVAIADWDSNCRLVGLAGSQLIQAGRHAGLKTLNEAFADRNYQSDGTLVPRDKPGAILVDIDFIAERVLRMVREGKVTSVDGEDLEIAADTVCIHSDSPRAYQVAKALRDKLDQAGVLVHHPFGRT
jgi:UPF0271 protein